MKQKETMNYEIADVKLRLHTPWKQKVSKAFLPFMREGQVPDWEIEFYQVEQMEKPSQTRLFADPVFYVDQKEDGRMLRQYHNQSADESPYISIYTDVKQKRVEVQYLPEAEKKLGSGEADFFCISLEKILMEEQAMALHAACVETPYGGILFSGYSGVGKSTQADLWCQYGGAALLNGDRPIIKNVENVWRAYGSPYAGSSGCHLDRNCEIRAIVFLKQAKQCSIRELQGVEKFRKLFENFTINLWDQDFLEKASGFIQKISEEIPAYEMECTKEREAVEVLEKIMSKRVDIIGEKLYDV